MKLILSIIVITSSMFLKKEYLIAQDQVTVTISGKIITRGGAGYGMEIGLKNIETKRIYFSKLISIFKQRHSIIENIPAGKYQVFYFQGIPATVKATNNINMQSVNDYFGVLEFKENKTYYLGSLIGRSTFPVKSPTIYKIEDTDIPEKLVKALEKRKIIEKDEGIIKTYPYKSDSLIILNSINENVR